MSNHPLPPATKDVTGRPRIWKILSNNLSYLLSTQLDEPANMCGNINIDRGHRNSVWGVVGTKITRSYITAER